MEETRFDTMVAIRRLRDAGFDASQAEAIATTIRDGVTGGVATKSDLSRVGVTLRADPSRVETGPETGPGADIPRMGARLETELKWIRIIYGAILAVTLMPLVAEAPPVLLR